MKIRLSDARQGRPIRRAARPSLEGLEARLLLYAASGGEWTYNSRVTYSLAPDGTNIGGKSSALFSTLNAKFATATWQAQFQKAAAVWQAVSDVNLVMVADNGATFGTSGNQQGDSRFGDIRIGAVAQSGSVLGIAYLPPPFNGGTLAGDIVLNSSQNWQINTDYDLLTVAIHEFGHSLGMDHSAIASADMYAYYTGMKQSLTADDTAGIQSVYGTRQLDTFDAAASNGTWTTATNITPYLDASAKLTFADLDITTTTDGDWYKVTVPSGTSGTMTVKMQSTGLSSLSPRVQVYNSALASLGLDTRPNTYGDTASVTISGVSAGQVYYIRATAANTGATGTGGYGLQVNLGSTAQPSIAPPYTTVASQPDMGGGSSAQTTSHAETVSVGTLEAWGDAFTIKPRRQGPRKAPQHRKAAPHADADHGLIHPVAAVDQILNVWSNPDNGTRAWARARRRARLALS